MIGWMGEQTDNERDISSKPDNGLTATNRMGRNHQLVAGFSSQVKLS